MDIATEVWANGKRVRAIRLFTTEYDFSIARIYAEEPMGDFKPTKFVSLRVTCQALFSCCGSEIWNSGIKADEAKAIIGRFRKSAEKAGFAKVGKYEGL